MSKSHRDLLRGTLDLLILKTLAVGPNHGWGVAQRIRDSSNEIFRVTSGSLYPALHRLEVKGLIKSEWGLAETGKRAKFYSLTELGKKEFERETEKWRQIAVGVELVLQMA